MFGSLSYSLQDCIEKYFCLFQVCVVGTFACSICSKKSKTQGGRSRHMISKHEENVLKGISVNELQSLLKHTQTDISQDLNYLIEVRNKISTIITKFEINRLHNVISPLYEKLGKNSNPDDFLAMFYGNIVRNCMVYIPNIPFQVAALTMKKLGDKIFHHYRKSTTPVTPTNSPTPITEDELEAVQYLSGYVVRKCSKKSPEESETFKILNEMITSDYSSQELIAAQSRGGLTAVTPAAQSRGGLTAVTPAAQSRGGLTAVTPAAQSRGGLTAVTPAAQSMFVKAEAKFRQETTSKSLKKIDTKQMVIDLMKDMDVISTYNRILQDISVDDEIKYALLMKMLALYLRVRSFSLARSLTTKYRLANKKGEQKALRKNLRNLSSQGD